MFDAGAGAEWTKAKVSEPPNCEAHFIFANHENVI